MAAYRARNRPSSTYAPAPRQCFGLTSSGQCTSSPVSQGFCSSHQEQGMWQHPAAADISAADRRAHAESRRCCGLTKKYALCNNRPGGNFMFCWRHGGQRPLNGVGAASRPEPPQTATIRERMREFHRIQRESQASEYEVRAREEQWRQEQARARAEREEQERQRQYREQEQRRAREEEDARRQHQRQWQEQARARMEAERREQAQRASQEQDLEAPSTPEPEAYTGAKKRILTEEDDCPICCDSMHGANEALLTFCEECGNAVHGVCFTQWKQTKAKEGKKLTCVYCRAEWPNTAAAGGRASSPGVHMTSAWYTNISGVAGASSQRDTSTYYHGSRRGRPYYGYNEFNDDY